MTVFNVECFYLGVKYITARYCDFTNVILSVFKFVIIGIDVSVLVGNILCKRSAVAVGDKKCYAADAFACYRIHLVNEKSGILAVGKGNTGYLAVRYFNIVRFGVKNVIVGCLYFGNGIPAVRKILNIDNAV